ncbi:MAG: hypothetical protein II879_00870 [Clostridia bacterium]|nr:hypothetical protein [Clostridia bacterium]
MKRRLFYAIMQLMVNHSDCSTDSERNSYEKDSSNRPGRDDPPDFLQYSIRRRTDEPAQARHGENPAKTAADEKRKASKIIRRK